MLDGIEVVLVVVNVVDPQLRCQKKKGSNVRRLKFSRALREVIFPRGPTTEKSRYKSSVVTNVVYSGGESLG